MNLVTNRRRHGQRGLSFISLVLFIAFGVSLVTVGIQVFPTVVEFMAAKRAIERAKNGNTVAEVREIFQKASDIDNISSISGKDLDISKNGDKVIVQFAYTREIHLVGPAFLVLKYNATTN
jgi:hypothetical protein